MIALLQRVNFARVSVDGNTVSQIDKGILALIGMERGDFEDKAEKMANKILKYRMFSDDQGKLNLSLKDIAGGLLAVPQFTLAADTKHGLRPSFDPALAPVQAEALFTYFIGYLKDRYDRVEQGRFGADMQVLLENDGPVTFSLRF